jgi:hypothetical protein
MIKEIPQVDPFMILRCLREVFKEILDRTFIAKPIVEIGL